MTTHEIPLDYRNAASLVGYTAGYALARGVESWLRRVTPATPDSPATIDARDTRDTYRDLVRASGVA